VYSVKDHSGMRNPAPSDSDVQTMTNEPLLRFLPRIHTVQYTNHRDIRYCRVQGLSSPVFVVFRVCRVQGLSVQGLSVYLFFTFNTYGMNYRGRVTESPSQDTKHRVQPGVHSPCYICSKCGGEPRVKPWIWCFEMWALDVSGLLRGIETQNVAVCK
jgi:hypothetical protein